MMAREPFATNHDLVERNQCSDLKKHMFRRTWRNWDRCYGPADIVCPPSFPHCWLTAWANFPCSRNVIPWKTFLTCFQVRSSLVDEGVADVESTSRYSDVSNSDFSDSGCRDLSKTNSLRSGQCFQLQTQSGTWLINDFHSKGLRNNVKFRGGY